MLCFNTDRVLHLKKFVCTVSTQNVLCNLRIWNISILDITSYCTSVSGASELMRSAAQGHGLTQAGHCTYPHGQKRITPYARRRIAQHDTYTLCPLDTLLPGFLEPGTREPPPLVADETVDPPPLALTPPFLLT